MCGRENGIKWKMNIGMHGFNRLNSRVEWTNEEYKYECKRVR